MIEHFTCHENSTITILLFIFILFYNKSAPLTGDVEVGWYRAQAQYESKPMP